MADRANDTPLSFTLREMRSLAGRTKFWMVLFGVILLLTLTGPFDTYGRLALSARAAYWAAAGVGSCGIGLFCSMLTAGYAERAGLPERWSPAVGGLVAGIPVAAWHAALNRLAFGGDLVAATLEILPYAMAITAIVASLYELLANRETGTAAAAVATAGAEQTPLPALLDKLPPHLGRDIVHLQAQDHYVKVTTLQGSALVLMRIGDAERDLASLGGLRIHRSWWVSRRHAVGIAKHNGQDHVVTSLGTRVPIGRAYRKRALSVMRTT